MTAQSELRHTIMKTPFGQYVWWPLLGIVDYVVKGHRKGIQIACLQLDKNNTELGALIEAAKHLGDSLRK